MSVPPPLAPPLSRRSALAAGLTGAAALAAGPARGGDPPAAGDDFGAGRLKQSVCAWCFRGWSLDELCGHAVDLGLAGVDLIGPGKDFETLKKHGLVCTMTKSHSLADGLSDPKFHDACLASLTDSIEATAAEGWRNVITFSGNARGVDPAVGLDHCAKALKQIVPLAEKMNVTICMELLNSKVDHPDYLCDNSAWGVKLVDAVASDNFKLLYDVYHMQIMEGDILRTIKTHGEAFGHYHTAGNPGRHELDGTQELQYRPIAEAIAGSDYSGYFAHEFIPADDPLAGLTEAVKLCTV